MTARYYISTSRHAMTNDVDREVASLEWRRGRAWKP